MTCAFSRRQAQKSQIDRAAGEGSVRSQALLSEMMQNRDMTSKTTRIAAASLLALTLPLVQGTAAHAEVRTSTIVPVRSQTEVVTRDITLAAVVSLSLPATVRAQVDSAIMSAQAATTAAQSAITAVDTADAFSLWTAQTSLHDARTALDAASAELPARDLRGRGRRPRCHRSARRAPDRHRRAPRRRLGRRRRGRRREPCRRRLGSTTGSTSAGPPCRPSLPGPDVVASVAQPLHVGGAHQPRLALLLGVLHVPGGEQQQRPGSPET